MINRISILGLLIFVCCATQAQSIKSVMRSGKISLPSGVTPLSISNEYGNYFATNVSINGHLVEGKFLIDTGSDYSIISQQTANKLGLECIGQTTTTDGYKEITSSYVKARLTIDEVQFENVGMVMIEDDYLGLGVFCQVKGIIGSNIIRQAVWRFTPVSVEIMNDIDEECELDEYTVEKLILQGDSKGVPYLVATFGRPRGTFLFDTGDNGFIQIYPELVQYVPERKERVGKGRAVSMLFSEQNATDTTVYSACRTDTFNVAGLKVKQPIAYVEGTEQSVAIGSEFFNYFETIFDFPRKKIYLKQIKWEYSNDHWNTNGIKTIIEDDKVWVRFVWDQSSAARQGLKPGQRILQINELDLRDKIPIPSCEIYQQVISELDGDSVKIVIEGFDEELVLVKESLFEI